jgi:hypothetical protein
MNMMQDTFTPPPEVQRLLRSVKARPPAGAGANRWDRQRLLDTPHLFHQLMAQAQFKREAADPTPTRTRKRKPTVASVIRQMKRAGVEVAGCKINPHDGTVMVVTGKPVGSDIDMDDTASPDPKWN